MSSDFSTETFQARKDWHEIFKVMKSIDPARLSFKIEGEIKSFPDKKKLKEFVTTKPVLQEMLREGGGGKKTQQRNIIKRLKWQ